MLDPKNFSLHAQPQTLIPFLALLELTPRCQGAANRAFTMRLRRLPRVIPVATRSPCLAAIGGAIRSILPIGVFFIFYSPCQFDVRAIAARPV
jgi:hypothetical protein